VPAYLFRLKTRIAIVLTLAGTPAVCQTAGSGSLHDYLTRTALEQLAERRQTVARITTRASFEPRRKQFRKDLLRMIGGLPKDRTPLNVRVTGTLERDGYRVEKLIFGSQPGVFVTANLYIPTMGKPPYPAVLHSTGHSVAAKARAFYQTLSLGLVKHGFVVLPYDPLGQGERREFYDAALQDSKVGGTTAEHEMLGLQSLLAGESIARQMIWDGMRGIDLLQSRGEVDRNRIGATGCSGGGTMTTYLAALDDRIRVAAPACYITSWDEQLRSDTGPQDAEQQFPDLLRLGYDHGDYVASFAPKPYLICSTDQDFFPLEGARRTWDEVKRIYSLFDAADRVDWFHEPGGHGMPVATREAIYGWMTQWLKDGPRGPAKEPAFLTEYEENLYATSTGQLATSLGGSVGTWNLARFRTIAPARPVRELRARVIASTRYQRPTNPLDTTATGAETRRGYKLEKLQYTTGTGRFVRALLAVPDSAHDRRKTVIHTSDRTAADAFIPGGDLDQLASSGYTVFAVDTAGRGEYPRASADSWFTKGDKDAWLALMTGQTLVGLRMADIIRGMDLLSERNLLYGGKAVGIAKGLAGVELLHAAAVDDRFSALALEEMLISYRSVAQSPIHRHFMDALIPGVLGKYDLPDLVAAAGSGPVWIINARSPVGAILRISEAAAEYKAVGNVAGFRIGLRRENESIFSVYPELK
jgi:cephalosporin-C deacetylase-like acetyl esterase